MVCSAERKPARLRILDAEVLPVKEERGTLEAVALVDALLPGLAAKGEHVVRELEELGATVDSVAGSVLGTRDEFLYKALDTRENHTKGMIAVVVQVGMGQQLDDAGE